VAGTDLQLGLSVVVAPKDELETLTIFTNTACGPGFVAEA
jgi:hypothetical protein